MSKVPDGDRCTRESLPAGARHASVARDGVGEIIAAKAEATREVEAEEEAEEGAEAEAESEAEGKAEAKLDGAPSSIDDIRRLEPVWTGGTLHPQCSKHKENEGECAHTDNRMQIQ